MSTFQDLLQSIPEIESKIGYTFRNRELIALAFIHRSYINENRAITAHNERLEFLGDSILGLLIADFLYKNLPDIPEGELSHLRSRLVEAISCVYYIQKLDLGKYLLLGKGERMNDGRGRDSILADLFEAVIGAIYVDGDLQAASNFFFSHFNDDVAAILKTPDRNWKAILQDFCQRKYQQPPIYKVIEESGPDHSKMFKISVFVNDQPAGHGEGSSKKEAQQSAAEDALKNFGALT